MATLSTTNEARYDRQIRLWGDDGQACIQQASVCMLGSSALACEILKNLVLAGIRSFHIVDAEMTSAPDSGNNFFVQPGTKEPRAESVLKNLLELNPFVEGRCTICTAEEMLDNDRESLTKFSVVVAVNLSWKTAAEISEYLFGKKIPFVHSIVYGFVGYVRIAIKEHTIVDTHEENPSPDLRLDHPFPSVLEMAQRTDLSIVDYETHSRTPYLILYLIALSKWYDKHGPDSFPDDAKKRKEFVEIYLSMRMPHPERHTLDEENFNEGREAMVRSLRKTTIPTAVKELFDNPNATNPPRTTFWLIIAAMKRFLNSSGAPPISGKLPDMISDSQRYVALASIYREKAESDAHEVYKNALALLNENNWPMSLLKLADCQRFCKNWASLKVQFGSTIESEMKSISKDILRDIRDCDITPHKVTGVPKIAPAIWYLLLRAVDRFHSEKSRYPGTNGVPCSIDAHDLKSRVSKIIADCDMVDQEEMFGKIPQLAIDEMCRYGASEPHVIAALVGGIAAQEVIKLATHQYIPLNNTFIFDGHTQEAHSYQL